MIDYTEELESLDFAMFSQPERHTGRMVRADERTFLIHLKGGKVIGKAHSEDLARARAKTVRGYITEVAS